MKTLALITILAISTSASAQTCADLFENPKSLTARGVEALNERIAKKENETAEIIAKFIATNTWFSAQTILHLEEVKKEFSGKKIEYEVAAARMLAILNQDKYFASIKFSESQRKDDAINDLLIFESKITSILLGRLTYQYHLTIFSQTLSSDKRTSERHYENLISFVYDFRHLENLKDTSAKNGFGDFKSIDELKAEIKKEQNLAVHNALEVFAPMTLADVKALISEYKLNDEVSENKVAQKFIDKILTTSAADDYRAHADEASGAIFSAKMMFENIISRNGVYTQDYDLVWRWASVLRTDTSSGKKIFDHIGRSELLKIYANDYLPREVRGIYSIP